MSGMGEESARNAKPRSRIVGSAGAVIGMLALALAVLPSWLLPAVFPPPPVDHVIVDTASRLKARVVAKAQGVEYRETRSADPAAGWSRACSIGAVSLGLLAIGCAVFSVLRREPLRYAGTAAAIGASAIAFEVAMLALGVLVMLALIALAANYLDVLSG
jgi:hypothetical protein